MQRSRPSLRLLTAFLAGFLLLAGCRSPQFGGEITISLTADGSTQNVRVGAGSTVLQALQQVGLAPGEADRAEPPFYTVLRDGDSVKLTRVREEFQTDEGEAKRDDERFCHVAAWEYTGEASKPKRNVEPLQFENVHLATRSYK